MKDLPIKYQLIIMTFTISLVSLWIATAAFVLYDRYTYKVDMVQELTILARVVATRSASAVMSNDKEQASRNLEVLGVKTSIISACVTTQDGQVFAYFSRTPQQVLDSHQESDRAKGCIYHQDFISRFSGDHLDLLQPVLWKESQKIGELHIREDLSLLNKRFGVFSVVILLIVVLSSIVAIMLSSRIQSYVSTPILSLIDIADRITRQQDYTLRAKKFRNDEMGKLVDTLNTMLDTLEEQNRALLGVKDNLEEQVEERTKELRNINRELEAFTYSVSHDLRSPLRSVEGFSTALLEDFGHKLDPAGLDYLQRIHAASLRMATLIDSLLYLSRVSRQDVAFQAVDLVPQADEIVARLREQYPARPVAFICPKTLLAYGDKTLLVILLENLLGNAWKYTAKVTLPQVELGVVDRKGEQVYFVRDNGAGFDMKFADKLFGPFQRLHRSEDFDGLGIGLATAARIIHRHSGEIWAESIVGAGAVIYFTLGVTR
jgi:signal transduction histidine kinase